MRSLRAATRIPIAVAGTVVLYLILVAGMAARGLAGSPTARWKGRMARVWARFLLRVANVRLAVEGSPPAPPFFLVANHLSYMDALVLLAHVEGVFVAKSEIASWPIVGLLCRTVNTIFIERRRIRDIPSTLSRIEGTLRQGRGVVLFPEGTSTGGETVGRFRPSLLEPAAQGAIPVACATLTYATRKGERSARWAICWWADMSFAPHAWGLFGLPGFEARLVFSPERIVERDRKALAQRSWQEVHSRFVPTAP